MKEICIIQYIEPEQKTRQQLSVSGFLKKMIFSCLFYNAILAPGQAIAAKGVCHGEFH